MSTDTSIYSSLQRFAANVAAKMTQLTIGEPEDQLRGPFENLMAEIAKALGWNVVCTGETPLPNHLGRPDFAVHLNNLLAGYAELKAPGIGVTPTRFKGHNRNQFKRFSAIPNILYSDGNDWALYREGELVGKVVRLSGDVATHGIKAVVPEDAHAIKNLLREFFLWQPSIPADRKGRIDLKGLAALLAPLCRMLRDDVTDTLKNANSPLVQLAKDWRQLLFPEAPDDQFADAYAQTVTFALLLGRSEGANPLSLEGAEQALAAQHNLLSRALQVLTDPAARREIATSVDLLLRVIGMVPLDALVGPEDPWLYFYEDFLAVYDPELRKNAGAYYTPVQVVRCQVRLIDDLLVHLLGKPLGFANPGVVTLDPAAGTGTYLLGIIDHALGRVEAEQGKGAVPGKATELANTIYGFELMVGPYAVAELRVTRALHDRGAQLPKDGTHVYLTDTLESPNAKPPQLPLFLRPIAEQHAKALKVKSEVPVIVCLGNPPYDRNPAATVNNKARTGGWVRWGDSETGADAIFRSFLRPAVDAGYGLQVHNLYNLYVYFWCWALWKVFEHEASSGPGIVSFISASSYVDGAAFCGMREHMRRQCDEIWIIDLGGEGRGTRKSENVFDIQTPVTIAVAVRSKKVKKDKAARVHYARIDGTREDKYSALDAIHNFSDVTWQDCPDDWQAPFRPAGEGSYFEWPLLTDLMPLQQSGVKAGRTWVISPEQETLTRRWRELLRVEGEERRRFFKDSPTGCKVAKPEIQLPPSRVKLKLISELAKGSHVPEIIRYSHRSLDRQFIIADARLLDRPGPGLWAAHSERQVYLTSLLTTSLGTGPALTACAQIPDLHHFSGRGQKDVVPLYRMADASEANILPGLLKLLGNEYSNAVTPEDFLTYVYGGLAQPSFTSRFAKELGTGKLHVPITKDAALFERLRVVGAHLLWLHTFGQRFLPKGKHPGFIPQGKAKCTKAVPGNADGYPESFEYNPTACTLNVGDGSFAPVSPDVYGFVVSGLKVVQSWLKYRMKAGAGKKSSPLNDILPTCWTGQFTTELLELLWVLEATVEGYPEQAQLLEEVMKSDLFCADELPPVPGNMRKPPGKPEAESDQLEFDADS